MVEFHAALRSLEACVGPGAASRIVRTDVARDGSLEFTLDARPGWVRVGDHGSAELDPRQDERLPLAGVLEELLGEGASVLAWRPGRRLVVHDRRRGRVLKGLRPGRAEGARLRWTKPSSSGGVARVPALLDDAPAPDTLALEWVEGSPFHWQAEVLPGLLDGIAALPTEGLEVHDRAAELGVLETFVLRLARVALSPGKDWWRARARLEELGRTIAGGAPVACHRDLHDGQLLLASGRVVLLDLDTLVAGEPELDAGNLLAHHELRRLQDLAGARAVPREDVLDAVRRTGPEDRGAADRLRWYEAASLLRLALLYRLRPRWSPLCDRLTELAGELLHEPQRA